jgi:NADPH-dependent 2,4-dienoyl-CoA reductase/sulfur reductase-like enzyme
MRRRQVLGASGAALALAALRPLVARARGPLRKVVVVGAGYAGLTAAKLLRQASDDIDVVLVERGIEFTSCPLSNLVIGGSKAITDVRTGYFLATSRYGMKLLTDEVVAIDADKREVRLARGGAIDCDRVILAPGVDFAWEEMPGMAESDARVLHAWKAGRQTTLLRKQLEDMKDGGVFVISIPAAPYRGLAAPYERACLVAGYLYGSKRRSKVLILDANPDITAKGDAFRKAWAELYPGMVEYRPNSKVVGVDAATLTARTETDSVKADVLNVIPPMRAGKAAASLLAPNARWCDVDFLTYEVRGAPNVHVLGDSLTSPPGMPKSASLANAEAKVCVAALLAQAAGKPVSPDPTLADTCYSFVSSGSAVLAKAQYKYDAERKTMVPVEGAATVSEASDANARQAQAWARGLWNDMLK